MSCCCHINRREFVGLAAAGLTGAALQGAPPPHAAERPVVEDWDPDRPQVIRAKKLAVQPLLRHEIETRKPQRSGDMKRLAREIRGSHWMMARGDYLQEMGYAVGKMGLEWLNISEG